MVPFRLSRREIWRVFALTALFFFAAYLSRFVSFGFTHDSLQIDQSGGALFQISLGRFMQPLYWLVRGDIVMPYVVGLLSFTFLSASICLCCSLLAIRSTLGIACVCMTLCCNATLSLSSATFISWLDVYMLALLLSVLSVCLCESMRLGFLLAPFVLCLSLGLYQSYLQTAILLFLMLLIHRALDGDPLPSLVVRGFKALFVLLAGLLLYALFSKLAMRFAQVNVADTYNGIAHVGDWGDASVLSLLAETYVAPLAYLLSPETIYPRWTTFTTLAIFALSLPVLVSSLARQKKRLHRLFVLLMLLLVPLGANAVSFISGGLSHALMIYSYFFVLLLPLSLAERHAREENIRPRQKLASAALLLSCALLYAGNAAFAQQLILRRNLEYQSTLSLMTRVIERADTVEGYSRGVTPVVFSGSLFSSQLAMERPGFEGTTSLFGENNLYAITAEDYYPWYVNQILGYPMRFDVSLLPDYLNRAAVRAMPVFPAEGSIQMIDGVLVVHIGRQQLGV